jgi:hypothetical protein
LKEGFSPTSAGTCLAAASARRDHLACCLKLGPAGRLLWLLGSLSNSASMTRARGSVGGHPTAEIRPGSGTELDQCTSEIGSIGLGTLAGGSKSARASGLEIEANSKLGDEAELASGRNQPQIQGEPERSACASELCRTERCVFRPLRCFRHRREGRRGHEQVGADDELGL